MSSKFTSESIGELSEAQKFAYSLMVSSLLSELFGLSWNEPEESWLDLLEIFAEDIAPAYSRLKPYRSICALSQAVDMMLGEAIPNRSSTLDAASRVPFFITLGLVSIELDADRPKEDKPKSAYRLMVLALYYGLQEQERITTDWRDITLSEWQDLIEEELMDEFFDDQDYLMDDMFNPAEREFTKSGETIDRELLTMKVIGIPQAYYNHELADIHIPDDKASAGNAIEKLCERVAKYAANVPLEVYRNLDLNLRDDLRDALHGKILFQLNAEVEYAQRLPSIYQEIKRP